ncbi:MAG: c-type cytochrome [Bacteroidia bacterium]|nr:c-type cytochrome [Bacteroidia bacterium]MBP9689357.1 c-type cytochrome [Bacteroidia bacterium]
MRFLRITSLFALLAIGTSFAKADVAEGEQLFTANCSACHALNERVVGPALKGINEKYDEAWLTKWIKNSQAMVKAGDAKAVKIYKEYNEMVMTSFENLSDAQVKSILEYIATPPVAQVAEAPTATGGEASTSVAAAVSAQDSFYNSTTFIALSIMALVLLVIVFVLYRIKNTVQGIYDAKFPEQAEYEAGEVVDIRTTWKYKLFTKHPVVGAIVVIVGFTVVFGLYGFDYAQREVGVQQDYAPTQPINYSHELHAGKYKINCLYCHTGADKGKQATIPSASTCMNCHMHVTASAKYDGQVSPEIAKIYDAVGWDNSKKAYDPNKKQQPIKWVRIHNLPDLAYFNHAQHVKAGQVECQSCHGAVETMKVVYQQSSLQMGWCINCHREAKVDVDNNDYYEKLHDDLKAQGKSYATVSNIGGLECGKCHY